MNKHMTMVGGFAALMLLVGAGCGASQQAQVETNTDTQPTSTEETQGEDMEMAAGIAAGTYQVDTEASTVTWFGKRTVGNQHRGTVELTSGSVVFADAETLTDGAFVIDMSTIEDSENNERLESHLKNEDFFEVETYPTSQFELTSATLVEGNQYEVTGDLTIKETTKEITFPATIVTEGEGMVRATATFMVDRAAFDVRYGSGSFFEDLGDSLIEDDMEFTLDLVAAMEGTAMQDDSMMMEEGTEEASEDEQTDSMMEADAMMESETSADADDSMGVTVETEGGVEVSL